MLDREDYRELQERRGKDRKNGIHQNLEYLVQAQLHQKNLTGNEHFDRFLTYIQNALNECHIILGALEKKICDPAMYDSNEVMETKLSIARMMGRIDAMNAIIELPNEIIESGERARERLKALGE